MVEEVVMALILHYAAVVGKRPCVLQWHNFAHIFPRTCRAVRHRIGYMLRHSACRIEHVVLATAFLNPRAFGVAVLILHVFLSETRSWRTESLFGHLDHSEFAAIRNHVVVELEVVDLRIAPVEPCLSVVVNHHRRVYVVPRSVLEERFAYRVAERSRRRIAHSHTYRHAT